MTLPFDKQALYGLTLEEAVRFLTPLGYMVMVHRHDEDEYSIEELESTYRVRKLPHRVIDTPSGPRFVFAHKPTASLDIQDGRVYEVEVYFPEDEENEL